LQLSSWTEYTDEGIITSSREATDVLSTTESTSGTQSSILLDVRNLDEEDNEEVYLPVEKKRKI